MRDDDNVMSFDIIAVEIPHTLPQNLGMLDHFSCL
jgi:hypothetical protein